MALDGGQGFETAQARQIHVEQDEIRARRIGICSTAMQEIQGFHAIPDEMQFMLAMEILHQLPEQIHPGGIVIDDENTKHYSHPSATMTIELFSSIRHVARKRVNAQQP